RCRPGLAAFCRPSFGETSDGTGGTQFLPCRAPRRENQACDFHTQKDRTHVALWDRPSDQSPQDCGLLLARFGSRTKVCLEASHFELDAECLLEHRPTAAPC